MNYKLPKVIAEIGCNHKGEIDLAKELISVAAHSGVEVVKFQKRNSKELLRRLHVKENEKVIEGAEAFLALWKKMPKYKFLYNFFKLPIIFNLFSFGYEVVAFF